MTSLECQSAVYDLAAEFFSRANINVARQNAARPPLPFVTLNFGIISRVDGISAVKAVVDGVERRSFSVQQNCTIELVTKGEAPDENTQPVDTAVEDLQQFSLFLSSEYAGYFMQRRNMDIRPSGDCIPIYNLSNDVSVPFRASLDVSITYQQTVEDMALLRTPGKQYAQRGSSGSADLAAMQASYMSEAEINYKE